MKPRLELVLGCRVVPPEPASLPRAVAEHRPYERLAQRALPRFVQPRDEGQPWFEGVWAGEATKAFDVEPLNPHREPSRRLSWREGRPRGRARQPVARVRPRSRSDACAERRQIDHLQWTPE